VEAPISVCACHVILEVPTVATLAHAFLSKIWLVKLKYGFELRYSTHDSEASFNEGKGFDMHVNWTAGRIILG